jgi:hypothetical protein
MIYEHMMYGVMFTCLCLHSVQTVTEVLHALGVIRCVGPTKVQIHPSSFSLSSFLHVALGIYISLCACTFIKKTIHLLKKNKYHHHVHRMYY